MERFIDEVWNKGNVDVADEIFHPEASSPSAPGLPLGPEGVKFIVKMMRDAFSDYWMEITHLVAEDDRVAARFRQGGTHDGDLMGIPRPARRSNGPRSGSSGSPMARSWRVGMTSTCSA